jgi:bacillopeptidase F
MPPLPPRLIVNYEATNSATINISGLSESQTNVELLKNDVSVGKVVSTDNGDFVFTDISLDEGENTFWAIASKDKLGSSDLSKMVKIEYDKTSPTLTMTNPSEDAVKVDTADFDVVGQSEKGVSVTVNNRLAMVDDNGKFKIKFQLNAGKNDIEIVVRDLAGNETRKKITITFEF